MSVPLGFTAPPGVIPKWLPKNRLSYDVETLVGSQPGTGVDDPTGGGPHTVASGTANSIVPRRQLSQNQLPCTWLALPPASHMPVPTGAEMNGSTSLPGW